MEITHTKHVGAQITGLPPDRFTFIPFIHRFCALVKAVAP